MNEDSRSRLAPPPRVAAAAPLHPNRTSAAFGERFFLALLLGLVWLGPSWLDLRFLWGMAAWDLVTLLLWLQDWRRLPRPETVEVERVWQGSLSQGVEAGVQLSVRQVAGIALRVTLTDDPPAALGLSSSAPPQFDFQLPAGGKSVAAYAVRPIERGDAEVGRVFLRYQSALQLAERRAVADLRQTVRVYPNLEASKRQTLYLIRSRQIEVEKRLKRQRGFGREFESLREYLDGDEPRDICWTATARRGRLISKTYQVERSQSVLIVLDAGRLMLARTEPAPDATFPVGLTKLDCAVAAALGLAQVALYSGDAIGLLAYGRKFQSRLPAMRGKGTLRALVELLAVVRGELLEADHSRAADTLLAREKRRGLVVWLTDLADTAATPEVVESASRLLHRHLLLLVPIGQPQLAHLVSHRPETASEMYRYAAAQEMITRRELLMRRLRSEGGLAVELAPGELASGLVNQYLEVKERGLL